MNYLRFKRRIFPVTMDNENSNITHLRSITDDQESVQKRLDDLVEEGPDVSRYSVIEPLDDVDFASETANLAQARIRSSHKAALFNCGYIMLNQNER